MLKKKKFIRQNPLLPRNKIILSIDDKLSTIKSIYNIENLSLQDLKRLDDELYELIINYRIYLKFV